MNKPDFTNWCKVKAYLDDIMKANIMAGKLIFSYDDYTELLNARRALNNVAEHWSYPLYFKILDRELYFYRRDV